MFSAKTGPTCARQTVFIEIFGRNDFGFLQTLELLPGKHMQF